MYRLRRYDEVEAEFIALTNRKGGNKMALRHYPKEIEELMKIWEPYEDKVKDGVMRDAPKEAIEAFNKCKKWAWEQGQ